LFEKNLKTELTSIFGQKVYPLQAAKDAKPPFVIYQSSEGQEMKSFDGYLVTKEIEVELNVIDLTYASMKTKAIATLEKIKSFQSRKIGGNTGVYVQDVTYEEPVELYETEVDWYRTRISFRVTI
jgi:hypothetical protein